MADYVTIIELAQEFGLSKSNARNYIVKNGFAPVLVRAPQSRGQSVHALTLQDADAVRMLRQRQGYGNAPSSVENGHGFFYVVQVVPDLDSGRVKLGFAGDAGARLDTHRCVSPTAELVKCWPCRKSWELAAIASITRTGCRLLAGEVYHCENVEALAQRADDFFGLMPKP